MNKMTKRFMALVIVFASIISFLPMQIGSNGKAAKAFDSTATDIQVKGDGTADGTVDSSRQPIYSTAGGSTYFSFTVKDIRVTNDALITALDTPTVTDQEVIIKSINRIRLDDSSTSAANLQALKDMGLTIGTSFDATNKRIGAKITGLPLGMNEITYTVKVTEKTRILANPSDPNDKTTKLIVTSPEDDEKTINIEHGNGFVQDQIPYIEFVDYIQGRVDSNSESNQAPFRYIEKMLSQQGKSLKFSHSLPNSVAEMDYKISFPNGIDADINKAPNNDLVYVNGGQQTNLSTSLDSDGKPILTGSLEKTATSTIILISIRRTGAIKYTYAIEIKYDTKYASDDYVLKDAGVKKLNYDQDSSVKAFIGKDFTTSKEDGVLTYRGNITIDRQAGMISMLPTIGRPSSTTAYKISNHYNSNYIENSKIINGKTEPYVNFDMGGTSNQIWLEVYEGTDGNIKTGTSALAIYKLNVTLVGSTGSNDVDFSLGSNTFLTQPGRESKGDAILFDPSRRTYNLNFETTATDNKVSITLDKPETYQKYDATKRREYIKVWSGTSTQSDNVTELDLGDPSPTATVDVTNYKKIIVQGYYDQPVYVVENGVETTKIDKTIPYPIGQKYTFYIAKNPDQVDPTVTKSTDASLIAMKAGNGTIKATDGTSGFSSDKTNYNVTVPKIDTASAITVTASSSKVKDITATLAETGDEYGLVSGQAFDFPLSATGKTDIKIVVTAEDGTTTKTYNLTISNDTRSASALLKDVVTDNGDFTFDAEKDPNKIRVDQIRNKLKVSPIPQDSNSRITVNGTKFTGTPVTIDLTGSQMTSMEIKVTSEDGSDSKTYNFEIYRTDSSIIDTETDNESDVFYDDIDDVWVDLSKYEEWGTVDGKTIYFNNKGRQVKNQWINTKGVWYFLNSKGYKSTGWRKEVGGKTYYLDPSTGAIKTGWMKQNNKVYYLGLNGVMQKGWLSLNGHWYYFTPEGEMIVNQSMYIDDGTYRFGADGAMY